MPTSTTFWALALALVLATLAALVVPLMRSRSRRQGPADDDASAAVYRDQKRQFDADVASGAISADEHDAAEAEIVARLGAELSGAPGAAAASSGRAPWIVAIAIVAIVPAAALVAYLAIGDPQALDAGGARPRMTDSEVTSMVEKLAQRMKENPSDPQGWLLLGRSWSALERYQQSADAFSEAARRLPGNADVLADWADALAMAQGRKLAGKPTEIIGQALAADPAHPKALALAASAAMERGDNKAAIRYWQALLAVVPPDSEDAQGIQATIAQLGGPQGAAPAPLTATRPSSPPSAAAPAASRITGRVEIAPALAARVPPDATLFVYARAAQGPRMPLAIVRRAARELPLEFALDDSMAMAPGATISSVREVVVEARVSASGSATAASGDLSGVSATIAPGTSGLRITIDRVVP
jgi:cytochrome c-type biogenesis protein CcmH